MAQEVCVSPTCLWAEPGAQSQGGVGEGAGPSGHRRPGAPWGSGWEAAGTLKTHYPGSQFQPWASSLPLCQHQRQFRPGFARESSGLSFPDHRVGVFVRLLPSVSSPVSGGGLETHPAAGPSDPAVSLFVLSAQAVSGFTTSGRQSSKSPGPRRHRSPPPPRPAPTPGPGPVRPSPGTASLPGGPAARQPRPLPPVRRAPSSGWSWVTAAPAPAPAAAESGPQ